AKQSGGYEQDAINDVFRRSLMSTSSLLDDIYQEGKIEGKIEGKTEGKLEGLLPLLHLYERRLARPLTSEEHRTIFARFDTLGPERLGDVLFEMDAEGLEQWLKDESVS